MAPDDLRQGRSVRKVGIALLLKSGAGVLVYLDEIVILVRERMDVVLPVTNDCALLVTQRVAEPVALNH